MESRNDHPRRPGFAVAASPGEAGERDGSGEAGERDGAGEAGERDGPGEAGERGRLGEAGRGRVQGRRGSGTVQGRRGSGTVQGRRGSGTVQGLLEPVVGVGLVVERGHLAVAGRPYRAIASPGCRSSPAGATRTRSRPRAPPARSAAGGRGRARGRSGATHIRLISAGAVVELDAAAADGLAVQGGDQSSPAGGISSSSSAGAALAWVEAAVEPARQLAEVRPQAWPGVRMPGVAPADLDRRGRPAAARPRPSP